MPISYAELITRGRPYTAAESVALALGALAAGDHAPLATLPDPEHIQLHANGTVTLTGTDSNQPDGSVRALAALLYRLLRLDADDEGPRQAEVPGPLMLMLARVRGEIDLLPPSLRAFRDVLSRLGSADPVVLAAIYARATPPPTDLSNTAVRHEHPPSASRSLAGAQHPPRSRSAWLMPAAFAAGCVAALTFVVAIGWTPNGVADRASVRQARANSVAAAVSPTAGIARERIDRAPTPLIARTLMTDAFSPSFATDGELLFHLGRTDGRLMKASVARDGAVSVTPLVEDAAANFHGVMSPDGTRLAFDSDREGTRAVYVAQADGTAPTRLSGDGFATTPSWSPDGTRVAFVKSDPGHPRVWNVWIADLRTARLTRVSHHRVGQAWRPSWFPDGTRLAYSVEDDLVVTDLIRGTSRSIRSPEPGHLVRTPAVSPDGRRVVFQVFGDGVWLFDLASGTMHRVLADRTAEEFAWSPDGKRIAFHARHVGRWSLWQLAL